MSTDRNRREKGRNRIHNPATDLLYYDSDGSAARVPVPIAKVTVLDSNALAASDFLLFS